MHIIVEFGMEAMQIIGSGFLEMTRAWPACAGGWGPQQRGPLKRSPSWLK